MIRVNEITEVYQTATVDTDKELKDAVFDMLPAFVAEVRLNANGKNFTVFGVARINNDGARYIHLKMQYLDDDLTDTDVVKISSVREEQYTIGVYSSPPLPVEL